MFTLNVSVFLPTIGQARYVKIQLQCTYMDFTYSVTTGLMSSKVYNTSVSFEAVFAELFTDEYYCI